MLQGVPPERPPIPKGDGVLEGRVTDESTGSPIVGARVFLRFCNETEVIEWPTLDYFPEVAHTDSDGRFRVENLPHRRHQIDVMARRYVPHLIQARLRFRPSTSFRVGHLVFAGIWAQGEESNPELREAVKSFMPLIQPGQVTGLEIALAPGSEIGGTVTDAEGQPISGVTVEIKSHSVDEFDPATEVHSSFDLPCTERAESDDQGRFALYIAPRGAVTLRASKSGFQYAFQESDAKAGTVPRLVLERARPYSVVVRLRSMPHPDTPVTLFLPREGGRVFGARTDSNGRATFDIVPDPRMCVLALNKDGGAFARISTGAEPLLDLIPWSALHGRVLNPDDKPIAGVMVMQELVLDAGVSVVVHDVGIQGETPISVEKYLPGTVRLGFPASPSMAVSDLEGRFELRVMEFPGHRVRLSFFPSEPHSLAYRFASRNGADYRLRIRESRWSVEMDSTMKLETAEDYCIRGGLRGAEDPAGALEDLDEAQRLGLDSADLHLYRSFAYLGLGRTPEAMEAVEAALRRDARHVPSLGHRAKLREMSGDLEGAEADCSLQIDNSEPSKAPYACRAAIRLRRGNSSGALEDARAAVRFRPAREHAWIVPGEVLEATGETREARTSYLRALELIPEVGPCKNLSEDLRERIRKLESSK